MKKVPHAPQKLPKKGYMYPWKEVQTTRFLFLCREGEFSFAVRAEQILVCAPIARGLLRSLALRGVGERWWGSKTRTAQSGLTRAAHITSEGHITRVAHITRRRRIKRAPLSFRRLGEELAQMPCQLGRGRTERQAVFRSAEAFEKGGVLDGNGIDFPKECLHDRGVKRAPHKAA